MIDGHLGENGFAAGLQVGLKRRGQICDEIPEVQFERADPAIVEQNAVATTMVLTAEASITVIT
jgi:hypothetical protein